MLVGPFTAFESLWIVSRVRKVPDFVAAALGFASEDIDRSVAAGETFLAARLLGDDLGQAEAAVSRAITAVHPFLPELTRAIRIASDSGISGSTDIVFETLNNSFRIIVGPHGLGAFELPDASVPDSTRWSESSWPDRLTDSTGVIAVYSPQGQRTFGFSGATVAEQSRDGSWSQLSNVNALGLATLVRAQ